MSCMSIYLAFLKDPSNTEFTRDDILHADEPPTVRRGPDIIDGGGWVIDTYYHWLKNTGKEYTVIGQDTIAVSATKSEIVAFVNRYSHSIGQGAAEFVDSLDDTGYYLVVFSEWY